MPAGNVYPSGHLVPSPILRLANAPIVETKFLELDMSLIDFSPRIPLGTFSLLLLNFTHMIKMMRGSALLILRQRSISILAEKRNSVYLKLLYE